MVTNSPNLITVWRAWNPQTKEFEPNHIEDGFSEADKPVGHPSWKSKTWQRVFAWLENGKVMYAPEPDDSDLHKSENYGTW